MKQIFQNDFFVIMGMAKTGIATVDFCQKNNINFVIWDDDKNKLYEIAKTKQCNILTNFNKITKIITSPGFKLNNPKIQEARKNNIPIICDIEIFQQIYKNNYSIGVTGTNGKSTTVSLINYIINQHANYKSIISGNIGLPVLAIDSNNDNIHVIELSSAQLSLCNANLSTSILINIEQDHIDYHGSVDKYIEAKKRIFLSNKKNHKCIICIDNEICFKIYQQLLKDNKDVIAICTNNKIVDQCIYVNEQGDLFNLNKQNIGNIAKYYNNSKYWQNIACSYAAIKQINISDQKFINCLTSFKNLPHRQELIAKKNEITFINDSKATNLSATTSALLSYKNIIWIAGGVEKEENYNQINNNIMDNVKQAFLIPGQCDGLIKFINKHKKPIKQTNSLEQAVEEANKIACKGDTILLSPACSSLNQFKNFEHRGNMFKKYVNQLN